MSHRLVTRSDFDGLVCAVLLRHVGLIDDITFVHPKDVQDGAVEITGRDILTNLPYVPEAHLVFDHHHSEELRLDGVAANHVIDSGAPSAARVVYRHFGGAERFSSVPEDLMRAVDQADSAAYDADDILDPSGWTLLNFLMDSRTGLGRFRDFRISNYKEQRELFVAQLRRVSHAHHDVVVVDLRGEEVIHAGNRFMVYALFPEARVSVHLIWGKGRQNTVLAVGKSIVDRSSPADIGSVMLHHGGGGHVAAGTCQVPHDQTERVLAEVLDAIAVPGVAVA